MSIKWNAQLFIMSICLSTTSFAQPSLSSISFSSSEVALIKQYLFNNITTDTRVVNKYDDGRTISSIAGAVLASPSNKGSAFSQDYQFHWVRDAAIVMNEVAYLYSIASPTERKTLKPYLLNYINFETTAQKQISKSGEQTLGQPKYNIDATIWEGPWGRPQNDGPALRAIAMTAIAQQFLQEGDDKFVREKMLNVITTDMDYVVSQWRNATFDLWEEVSDQDHFFTKIVQRKALIVTSNLLRKFANTNKANAYLSEANQITSSLEQHWNAGRGYLSETINQQSYKGGGLDTSVLLGVLLGNIDYANDSFAIDSDKVMSTVFYLRNAFASVYRVNIENQSNVPLIGRYPNDVYDGDQFLYGNPWILTTNALAEYYYTLAAVYAKKGKITVTKDNKFFFLQINAKLVEKEEVILAASHSGKFQQIINALVREGDKTLETVKHYGTCDADNSCNHFAEQIDRSSGKQTSAKDLTWGYSSLLAAMQARSLLL